MTYTKEQLSALRRLHGILEFEPMTNIEAYRDDVKVLRETACVPKAVLTPLLESMTDIAVRSPDEAGWAEANKKVMDFVEKIVEENGGFDSD